MPPRPPSNRRLQSPTRSPFAPHSPKFGGAIAAPRPPSLEEQMPPLAEACGICNVVGMLLA
jgi:hypothetical protein